MDVVVVVVVGVVLLPLIVYQVSKTRKEEVLSLFLFSVLLVIAGALWFLSARRLFYNLGGWFWFAAC